MTTCKYCDNPPVANYQKVWVRWAMTKAGDYQKHPNYEGAYYLNKYDEPTGENNVHVCKEHEEKFLDGDL